MNLDEAQKRIVAEWVAQGQKLSEIQKRLADELGVHMTYMEVRLLVDDLKLTPRDVEPPKLVELPAKEPARGREQSADSSGGMGESLTKDDLPPDGAGHVSVKVDELTRPGAVVSGSVTFSDGNTAAWYLDQFGRLGLAPKKQGYKPPADELQEFQTELQSELAKMGF